MRIIIVKCITLIVMLVPISSIHAQSTTYSKTYIDLGYLAIDGSVSCSNYESDITMAGVILDGYRNRINLKSNDIDFSGCKIISDRCFINDVSLDTIIIPEGVEEICNEAFFGCSSLKYVHIPATVKKIGLRVFAYCNALSTIVVDPDNPVYDSRDNCNAIIEKSTGRLVAGCQSTIIPYGVKYIGNSAFYSVRKLKTIKLPESVEYIDYYAFEGCKMLRKVVFSETLNYIGHHAFSQCVSLKRITLPKNITYTGYSTFAGCINLKKVKLSNIELINSNMFADCTSLKKITIPATVNTIGNLAFMDCPSLKTIKINNPNVCIEDAAFQFGSDVKIIKAK